MSQKLLSGHITSIRIEQSLGLPTHAVIDVQDTLENLIKITPGRRIGLSIESNAKVQVHVDTWWETFRMKLGGFLISLGRRIQSI